MIGKIAQRIALPYVCAAALLYFPLSSLDARAQSETPAQVDPAGKQNVAQSQQNPDSHEGEPVQGQVEHNTTPQPPEQNAVPAEGNTSRTPQGDNSVPERESARTRGEKESNAEQDLGHIPGQTPDVNREKPSPAPEPQAVQPQAGPAGQTDTRGVAERPVPANASGTSNSATLPETADELPLIGLLGLLCISLGVGTRALAKTKR